MEVKNIQYGDLDVVLNVDEAEVSIQKLLQIDINDIQSELMKQAGLFAYWSLIAARVDHELRIAEKNLRRIEEIHIVGIKDQYRDMGEMIPQYHIEAKVHIIPEYLQLEKIVIQKKNAVSVLTSIKNALWQRKNMLEAITSNQKQEYFSEPRVN